MGENMFAKNWKKLLALFLALAMVFSLAACNETGNGGDDGHHGKELTPKEQMILVERDPLCAGISAFMEGLGKVSADNIQMPGMTATEFSMDIRVGDTLIGLLEGAMGEGGMDLSALEKISMDVDMNVEGQLYQMLVGLAINDKKLADADVIMDMAAMTYWIGLPGLHEDYILFDLSSAMEGSGVSAGTATSMLPVLLEVMPDPEKLEPLLIKYVDVIFDNINNIEREYTTLELDGTKQDGVVLTYKLDEKTLADICLALMKTAKDDQELKAVIDELSEDLQALATEAGGAADGMDLYPQFAAFLEEGIASIEETTEYGEGNYILLSTSLDKKNNVLGRSFKLYSDSKLNAEFSFLTVSDSQVSNLDMRFSFASSEEGKTEVLLQGHSDLKNGAVTGGSYALRTAIEGEKTDWVVFILEDCSESGGTFTIEPTAALLRTIFGADAGALDLALQFIVNGEMFTTNLLLNDEVMVGIDITAKDSESAPIQKPSDPVDGLNDAAMQKWLEDLDLVKLLANWEAAGMPELNLG